MRMKVVLKNVGLPPSLAASVKVISGVRVRSSGPVVDTTPVVGSIVS
jgi:hypothetical protein